MSHSHHNVHRKIFINIFDSLKCFIIQCLPVCCLIVISLPIYGNAPLQELIDENRDEIEIGTYTNQNEAFIHYDLNYFCGYSETELHHIAKRQPSNNNTNQACSASESAMGDSTSCRARSFWTYRFCHDALPIVLGYLSLPLSTTSSAIRTNLRFMISYVVNRISTPFNRNILLLDRNFRAGEVSSLNTLVASQLRDLVDRNFSPTTLMSAGFQDALTNHLTEVIRNSVIRSALRSVQQPRADATFMEDVYDINQFASMHDFDIFFTSGRRRSHISSLVFRGRIQNPSSTSTLLDYDALNLRITNWLEPGSSQLRLWNTLFDRAALTNHLNLLRDDNNMGTVIVSSLSDAHEREVFTIVIDINGRGIAFYNPELTMHDPSLSQADLEAYEASALSLAVQEAKNFGAHSLIMFKLLFHRRPM